MSGLVLHGLFRCEVMGGFGVCTSFWGDGFGVLLRWGVGDGGLEVGFCTLPGGHVRVLIGFVKKNYLFLAEKVGGALERGEGVSWSVAERFEMNAYGGKVVVMNASFGTILASSYG